MSMNIERKNILGLLVYNALNLLNERLIFTETILSILRYLFLDILEKNDLTGKLNIKITSIESWFEGNKQLYDKIKNKNDFKTIFNKGSFMFLYKNIFQTYIDDYILVESNDDDEIQEKYLMKPFPFGLIQYFKDNHSIDKIIL